MKRGDIVLVEIPNVDGHEQHGFRPAIVVGPLVANTIVVIPLTTNIEALRFPYTHIISPNGSNGLKGKSIALIFQIRAIDKKRVIRKIGKLNKKELNNTLKILKKLIF